MVDPQGRATFSLTAGPGFPLRNPYVDRPVCDMGPYPLLTMGAAIAQLSPDGSSLSFATYAGACGNFSLPFYTGPALATAPDGSVYTAVNIDGHARILRFEPWRDNAAPARAR